jgi:hypothetical protein
VADWADGTERADPHARFARDKLPRSVLRAGNRRYDEKEKVDEDYAVHAVRLGKNVKLRQEVVAYYEPDAGECELTSAYVPLRPSG